MSNLNDLTNETNELEVTTNIESGVKEPVVDSLLINEKQDPPQQIKIKATELEDFLKNKAELDAYIASLPDPNEKDNGQLPKGLWIDESSNIVATIYLYKDTLTQDLVLIQPDPISIDRKKVLNLVEIPLTAEFTLPTRDQLNKYRDRSSKWNDDVQTVIPNRYLMRSLIMRNHLKAIDIIDPKTNERFKVEHDLKGRLTPQTESKLDKLHPSILEFIIMKFERVANIIY